ncbi:MAG: class I SAM-dependent methyltransferase [Kosmotoga sp.]|uniref:class I SAM-dependent methyltransferase n=1 Tax=Kosmotoga sp. TaxID=1955248 RepID=UPI001DA0AC9E|nr:methyltransferase [Kosmotoga sp.]MBO8166787.1 class I SAM-dependent methyltransferase [Kosmotoga sp.]MCD6160031.1 class I SAM-dependent methyltransferase [Kosmotoga sp.]
MRENSFEHYYTQKPSSSLETREVTIRLKNGNVYRFISPSGAFSFGKVDKASRLLVEYAEVEENDRVLDLGCGYGLIGITIKKEHPDITLFMSDINERALKYAKINARDNNITAEMRQGHLYEPWQGYEFDVILCNPPMAAGKKVWQEIVNKAPSFLPSGGKLEIVAFHNKGGSRLEKTMKEVFGNVRTTIKSGGIRVYVSLKF